MLDVAMVSWFPRAVSSQRKIRRTTLEALNSLAATLFEAHGDTWLHDLLQSLYDPNAKKDFIELSHAVRENLSGKPTLALQAARRAQAGMIRRGNQAGWLRAGLEAMYAFQRRSDSRRCLNEGNSLETELKRQTYRWMEAQLALELAICQNMRGEFALGYQALQSAITTTRNSNYQVMGLRAIGIRASFYTDIDSTETAWMQDQDGLARYWEGSYPAQRAFQFYADLANAAQKQNRLYAAAAFQREAALTISQTNNQSVEAMAWHRYGSLLQTAGNALEAEAAFQRADKLFKKPPQDPAVRTYWEDSELNLAVLEAEHGKLDSALQILNSIRSRISGIPNVTMRKRFYQTLGMLRVNHGDDREAEQALQQALALANAGFHKLKSEHERVAWEQETAKIYRGLVELRFRSKHDTDAALKLWRNYRALTQPIGAKSFRSRPSARPAQNSHGHQAANPITLTYAQLPDGIALWLTGRRGKVARWIDIKTHDLKPLVDRFAEDCSDFNTPPSVLQRDGYRIYQLMIEPVAEHLSGTDLLMVETDGVLTRVPVEALPDRHGKFLGLEYPIVVSQGNIDHSQKSFTINFHEHALVVGNPVLAPELVSDYHPLPSALQEAQAITNFFSRPKLLSNENATPQAIVEELAKADLFHFAGHTLFTPTGGRLLLAGPEPGGFLDAQTIEGIPPRSRRLAVLSSCYTETGEGGLASQYALSRAFLTIGFEQVVAAHWRIDSANTRFFMEAFYSEMLQGQSVPTALRLAAKKVASRPATSHPYYWAAFSLYV